MCRTYAENHPRDPPVLHQFAVSEPPFVTSSVESIKLTTPNVGLTVTDTRMIARVSVSVMAAALLMDGICTRPVGTALVVVILNGELLTSKPEYTLPESEFIRKSAARDIPNPQSTEPVPVTVIEFRPYVAVEHVEKTAKFEFENTLSATPRNVSPVIAKFWLVGSCNCPYRKYD